MRSKEAVIMAKLKDKLWNWGHLEGDHNKITNFECSMTPEGFAEEYGIKNAFIVSYGGDINPPFNNFAKRFSGLNNVIWSVLGDGSSPLPDDEQYVHPHYFAYQPDWAEKLVAMADFLHKNGYTHIFAEELL